RNHAAYQHSRNRRVPVREMKLVWLLCRRETHWRISHSPMWARFQLQSSEPELQQHPAIERRHCVNSHSKQPVRTRLIKRNCRGMNFRHIQQIILIADSRELVLLLFGSQPREIVDGFGLDAQNIPLRLVGKRSLAQTQLTV